MKKQIFAGILILALALGGCKASEPKAPETPEDKMVSEDADMTGTKAQYHKISQEEAKERMEENENAVIVDVRTREEYDGGHIQGAKLVPLDTIGGKQPEALPDKDAEIFVYCRTGVRSKQASELLVGLGYTNINDIGGIVDWPYGTVTDES